MSHPSGAATGARTEIIQDWADLSRLEGEWNRLLAGSRADSIFLTWEWIASWRKVVGGNVRPFVVAQRDDAGRLQAIAPFYVAGLRLLGSLRYRALRILGDCESGAEYGDWIVAREREDEWALALARSLAGARGWDCIWMPNVAGWTGARDRVATACAAAGLLVRERPIAFSAAELPGEYAAYWKALSGNARSAIQRQAKRIEADGGRFETCASPGDLDVFLDALVDLNHRRWSAAGGEGSFHRRPLETAFYREFTRQAIERGWLRICGLRMDGVLKAVQIGYVYGGAFLQLQEGFDPAAPPGLGNVVRSRVIEACIREGLTTYDFLGGHTDHKRRWLASARPGHDLYVARRSLKNALVHAAGAWPTGRYLRPEAIGPGATP